MSDERNTNAAEATIVAYDQQRAAEMLREWTPQQLLQEMRAGSFDDTLSNDELTELTMLLQDWIRRALGSVTLRDALWVDTQRGARVYDLLCQTLTVQRCQMPGAIQQAIAGAEGGTSGAFTRQHMQFLPSDVQANPQLAALLEMGEAQNLALVWYTQSTPTPRYPFPANLDTLLPPPPAPYHEPGLRFEQPTGWRRTVAVALAVLGVGWIIVPLLFFGVMPAQPAGLPLGLLTIALLVGIRANWSGYLGSLCIWLVPNLPGFHYGTPFAALPIILPLLALGWLLLACDRHVRAMWRWIRVRGRE